MMPHGCYGPPAMTEQQAPAEDPNELPRPPAVAYFSLGGGIVGLFALPYIAIAITSLLISGGITNKGIVVTAATLLGLPTLTAGIIGYRTTPEGATRAVAIAGVVLGLLTASACAFAAKLGLVMHGL